MKLVSEENNSSPYYDECQSCGKHFSSMIQRGSNPGFCTNCFQNEEFTFKTEDENEFINQSLSNELKTYNPRKKRKIIKKIKSLERWRAKY